MAGGTPVVLEHPIQTKTTIQQNTIQYKWTIEPDGWMVGSGYFKTNRVWIEIAGRWLGDGWAVAACYFQRLWVSLLNRCKMTGRWFAWLALAISYNFGCGLGSLGDGWRWLGDSWENACCIITPNKKQDHQYNTQPYSTHTTQKRMAGWLALVFRGQHRM